jgi:hypothetical protein
VKAAFAILLCGLLLRVVNRRLFDSHTHPPHRCIVGKASSNFAECIDLLLAMLETTQTGRNLDFRPKMGCRTATVSLPKFFAGCNLSKIGPTVVPGMKCCFESEPPSITLHLLVSGIRRCACLPFLLWINECVVFRFLPASAQSSLP